MALHHSGAAGGQFVPGGSHVKWLHLLSSQSQQGLVNQLLPGLLSQVQFRSLETGPQAWVSIKITWGMFTYSSEAPPQEFCCRGWERVSQGSLMLCPPWVCYLSSHYRRWSHTEQPRSEQAQPLPLAQHSSILATHRCHLTRFNKVQGSSPTWANKSESLEWSTGIAVLLCVFFLFCFFN